MEFVRKIRFPIKFKTVLIYKKVKEIFKKRLKPMTEEDASAYIEKVKLAIDDFPSFILFCAGTPGGFSYAVVADDDTSSITLDKVIFESLSSTPVLLNVFRDVIARIDADQVNEINLN